MRTANYSDLRQNLKTYIDSVIEDSDTVIINRGGGAGVVLMSLDEYNSIKETEYLMKSPENVKRIKAAEQEIRDAVKKIGLRVVAGTVVATQPTASRQDPVLALVAGVLDSVEAGEAMGVSDARARQIRDDVVRKVRHTLRAWVAGAYDFS